MRVFSQGQLARRIAQALLAAFLWSITMMGAGGLPASAQISTRAATAESIAVVPFQNLTTFQPDTLGARARELVSDELQTRLTLDVLPSKDVDGAMTRLGLKVPLSDSELVRLATEPDMDVPMVVTGEVRKAELVLQGSQRYAEVTLALLLFDRASAAAVNGATITAKSPISAEASAEDLVDKALTQAVFLGVQEMKTRPTVTAMVLWAKGSEIFTNSGTRAGILPGMQMVAVRGGQRIALVEVTASEATGSYGKIVEGSPLQTGDHLRAVWAVKTTEKPLLIKRAKKEGSRLEQVAVAAGLLLGLGSFIGSAKGIALGETAAKNARAADLANGSELGLSGIHSFLVPISVWAPDPSDPTADWSFILGGSMEFQVTGTSILTWDQPSGTQSRRIAGYFGFRDGQPVGAAFPTHDENWIIDDWAVPPGVPGATVGVVTIDVVPGTGQISVGRAFSAWDPDITVDATTGELTYNPEYNAWVDGFRQGGVINGINWGDTHVGMAWQCIGPFPGIVYEYNIIPIVIENKGSSTSPVWNITRNFWQFSNNKRVVSVEPPPGGSQTVFVSASAVSVSLYNPMGADEMVVQIARDAGPNQPIRFQNVAAKVSSSLNPNAPGPVTTPVEIKAEALTSLPGSTNVYWLRVGARNRSNLSRPLVYPVSAEFDQNDPRHDDVGWVWWTADPMQFTLGASASTEAAMKKQRDVLTNSRAGRGARIHRQNEGRELHIP